MLTSNLFKRWTYKFFAPDVLQRGTYEAFKRLLENDHRCHELIADFQDLFFRKDPTEWTRVISLNNQLSEAVGVVAHELSLISDRSTADLTPIIKSSILISDSFSILSLNQPDHPIPSAWETLG